MAPQGRRCDEALQGWTRSLAVKAVADTEEERGMARGTAEVVGVFYLEMGCPPGRMLAARMAVEDALTDQGRR